METREIRWFSTEPFNKIETTFNQLFAGSIIEEPERLDTYLYTSCNEVNIKIRDGQLDIKKRTSEPKSRIKIGSNGGYAEKWIKWSIDNPLHVRPSEHWYEVRKQRKLVFLDEHNKIKSYKEDDSKPIGLQIELTNLSVDEKTFHSIALEWSSKEYNQNDEILENLLKDSELKLLQSMGYPEYLSTIVNKPLALLEF